MRMMIVNGSPRKNWNTAQVLKSVQKGAESAGTEVEYIELYDLKFSGCRSCLACKRKGIAEPCKCYWKDELSPLLDRIYQADRLVIGSPIYYGQPSGMVRCLLERLTFPAMSYNDYSSTLKGKVDVDIFLTMNMDRAFYDQTYAKTMKEYFAPMSFLNGKVQIHPVFDTLQVKDYTKFDMGSFSEEHKVKVHQGQFPIDLDEAFKIGAGANQ